MEPDGSPGALGRVGRTEGGPSWPPLLPVGQLGPGHPSTPLGGACARDPVADGRRGVLWASPPRTVAQAPPQIPVSKPQGCLRPVCDEGLALPWRPTPRSDDPHAHRRFLDS
jgi:hypothetical protein